jgi:DNA topoisomerase 2-associated protein PAT1
LPSFDKIVFFQQMPPNFGPMRGPMAQPPPMQRGMPIPQPQQQQQQSQNQPLVSPHFQPNSNNAQNSVNQFNQRLLQEIQQNHPLLSMNRSNNNNNNNNFQNHQQYNNSNGQYGHHQQYNRNNSNGNVNLTEFDPYAGMMSQRDKHWLLGIQLMQLNTDTPYIDDFYYIVYKEREKQRKGRHESRAHADNKNNHPFTQAQQPNNHRGYAHLMFMSLKNGHHHQNKNGMQNRERKNSENGANKDKEPVTPRTYTPLQFENSLGKLQCGSVTAPRKIIDMEVVGPDANSQIGPTSEISAQRKSRQILLHIETMYKIVLKLEDLKNPIAITTALILKEKREAKEAIEQAAGAAIAQHEAEQQQQKNDNSTPASKILLATTVRTDSIKLSELETRADLLPRLLAGLIGEKVTQMMMVRKGRTLLKRALPHITDCGPQKWEVWCSIYAALLLILKKEKDDTEGTLINLFYEFERDLQTAAMDELTKLARILQMVIDKMTIYVFECKVSGNWQIGVHFIGF